MSRLRPRPARVLLFSSFADRGRGGQESLFQLACSLDRRRCTPYVVVPDGGSLAQSLAARGIEALRVNLVRLAVNRLHEVAAGLRRLGTLIDRLGVDILHTDGPRNTFYAAVAGRMKRKPVIWHVRAFASDPYDRLLYSLCSKLILVAEALRGRFSFCGDSSKLATIHNGVDLDRFKPEGSTPEAANTGAGRSEVSIATIGRIEAQKGLYNLLQACRALKRSGQAFKLRVAGEVTDPFYFQRCMDFCRKEGLVGQIEFLGHVQKMEEWLTSADIFVLPSAGAEAFPRSVLEAMACGKPVIVTDAGGSREAVESGKTGYVVPAQAPVALADRLRELTENEALRVRMGRTGRQRVEAHFGAVANAKRIMGVYEEVLR